MKQPFAYQKSENFKRTGKRHGEGEKIAHRHDALRDKSAAAIAYAVAARARGTCEMNVKSFALCCVDVNERLIVCNFPNTLGVGNGKALFFALELALSRILAPGFPLQPWCFLFSFCTAAGTVIMI